MPATEYYVGSVSTLPEGNLQACLLLGSQLRYVLLRLTYAEGLDGLAQYCLQKFGLYHFVTASGARKLAHCNDPCLGMI